MNWEMKIKIKYGQWGIRNKVRWEIGYKMGQRYNGMGIEDNGKIWAMRNKEQSKIRSGI